MLDCIEIDGASNNGVENVRDLIEKARFEPNQGRYKIYIIDEVHMLSTGAFNALLKTLEEPPDHVKFILATTEIDKVPETIRSRSLRFDFKKISEADIVWRLEYVCGAEGIKAETEALGIIARAARGALRDALTLTEQNTVNQEISTAYVRSTLSLIEDSLIDEIITTIMDADSAKMVGILDTLRTRHAEVRGLFDQIMYGLRDRMLESFVHKNTTNFAKYSSIFAVFESAYGRIRSIPDGWLLIEITLMRAVVGGEEGSTKWKVESIKSTTTPLWWKEWTQRGLGEETVSRNKEEIKNEQILHRLAGLESSEDVPQEYFLSSASGHKTTEIEKKEKPQETNTQAFQHSNTPNFSYLSFLEAVKQSKPALVTDLKTARFEVANTTLTLIFASAWHHGRINTPASRNTLSEILGELYQTGWDIVCRLDAANGDTITEGVF
jgi:DNA polymerase III gamma/tau subunit